METTYNHSIATTYSPAATKPTAFSRFFTWAEAQQFNRLLWIGISLFLHGCVLAPLVAFLVLSSGANMGLFVLGVASMSSCLFVNLAAMPTKVTIPVLILSILVDLGIIIATIVMGFNFSAVL